MGAQPHFTTFRLERVLLCTPILLACATLALAAPPASAQAQPVIATIELGSGSSNFGEGGTGISNTATFNLRLIGGTATGFMIPYVLEGVQAGDVTQSTLGMDGINGTLDVDQFLGSSTLTSRSLVFTAVDDNVNEGSETLRVRLLAPITATGTARLGTSTSAEITLLDNDAFQLTPSIANPNARTGEGGDLTVQFLFDNIRARPAVSLFVSYRLRGTGVTPGDFRPSSPPGASCFSQASDLTRREEFTPDQIDAARRQTMGSVTSLGTSATIQRSLATCDDTASEANESVMFAFTLPTTGVLQRPTSPPPVTATIVDNDPIVIGLSGPATPVTEGAEAVFTVRVAAGLPDPITGLTYSTSNGTAVGGESGDYNSASEESFTIPAGETTTTIAIQTRDDGDVESELETFSLQLGGSPTVVSNPFGAGFQLVTQPAEARIRNNDIRLSLQRTTPLGLVEEGTTVSFTVARTGTDVPAVMVQVVEIANGVTQDRVVEIRAGDSDASFDVMIDDDDIAENSEVVVVALQGPSALPGGNAVVVIPDDDTTRAQIDVAGSDRTDLVLERLRGPSPSAAVVSGGGSVAENGGMATYRVWLRGDMPSRAVPVSWSVAGVSGGGASAAAADFGGALPASGSALQITRAGMAGAMNFAVTVATDDEPEGDERFAVTATTAAAHTVVMSATVTTTIIDDDVGVGVGSAQSSVPEGEAATFTFTRTAGALDRDVTVVYSVAGVEGADFDDPQGGQVVIPSGQSSAAVVLAILDDGVTEDDETLRLTLDDVQVDGPGAGAITAEARTAAVVISQLVITAALSGPEQVQEGAVARFAVALAVEPAGRATTEEVVLAYTLGLSGDSATREADYEAPPGGSGTLRIPTGEVSGTIEVPVLRDRVREGEEEFSLAWVPERSSGGGGAIRFAATRQTVRILDLTDEEEARREQRTRALLAATGRAAAHMATDVITARSESQLDTQSDTDSAGDAATALATDALSTALRLTGLSPGSATPVGVDGTMLQPDAALFAGIDAPVGAVATGPTAPGSDDAQPGASAAELRDSGLRLPRLAELLRGVDFELRGSELGWDRLGEGLGIWGAGTFTSLEGDPDVGGGRLDYEGESYGLFVGADQRLELGAADAGRELLVGAALGWTRADLDYRDRPSSGFAVEGRFRSELLAIHPYASLRLSPRARLWLLAGYGGGDVEIEERESLSGGDALRRVETDATMWMVSAGAEGDVPLPGLGPASQLLVRFFGTRTSGSLDRARFDDDALLRSTRARTWRVAGELEGGHRFAFAEGAHFRPFVTARLRGDAGDDLGDDWEFSVDLGGGAELAWPERGLSLGLRGTAQLNEGARHREHRVVVDLRYDLAGDGRGLTVEVENTLEGSGRLGARAEPGLGAAFSPGSYGGGGSLGALLPETTGEDLDAGAASALRHSIRGEIGYGLVAALPSWARGADGRGRGRGLLTPYARFELAAGSRATAAGLRFESPAGARLGVEAGVDFHRRRGHTDIAPTTPPVYQFLLTGELRF